ncbi:hypothetical protein BD289DRAFT_58476 [Coniella lustricola]|uniref:Uncharacterized protein n=1 Tax=Coniella lustricola TaxID=2025994 RepID=A0A2T3AID1_9PEZI|nr:hypothetical protein BD289DRAFT_58476 [Coniella lustricola]
MRDAESHLKTHERKAIFFERTRGTKWRQIGGQSAREQLILAAIESHSTRRESKPAHHTGVPLHIHKTSRQAAWRMVAWPRWRRHHQRTTALRKRWRLCRDITQPKRCGWPNEQTSRPETLHLDRGDMPRRWQPKMRQNKVLTICQGMAPTAESGLSGRLAGA